MLNFLINCILWIFALYGVWQFIRAIISQNKHKYINCDGIYVIVASKNQEQQIEMYVRSVILNKLRNQEGCLKNIIVTDINSTDNTRAILEKFSDDYDDIKFIDWNNLKNNFDSLE